MLDRRKDGLYVFYRISDPTLSALCMLVCGRLREEAQQAAEAATA
jgi:ArsR family transcriptional regulator